ncbi:MAG: NUDIX hydrolase [Spirochaetota bacterium]
MTIRQFESYVTTVRQLLSEPLPGIEAHLVMAPEGRIGKDYDPQPKNARRGSVLLLLYPAEGGPTIPLIKRREGPSVHSGQIGLPGGAHEAPEVFPVDTALRETEEEIGIPARKVEVLGALSPLYIPPSNFSITPVVGALRESRPGFVPEPGEVAAILPVRVGVLSEGRRIANFLGSRGAVVAPCYQVGKELVWGATAMILSEYFTVHIQILKAY